MWLVRSDELLLEFFEFFASYNFSDHGVSVITGSAVEKPDVSVPVYIENPLERQLNVSKNVLEGHLQTFQTQCRLALDAMGQSSSVLPSRRKSRDSWGLLSILKTDDQLQLTEEPLETRTVADEEDIVKVSTEEVVDTNHVGHPHPQSLPVGVVNVHELFRGDNGDSDNVADNVSNRTV